MYLRSLFRKAVQIRFTDICYGFRQIRKIYASGYPHIFPDFLGNSRIRCRTVPVLFLKHWLFLCRRNFSGISLVIFFLLKRSKRFILHLQFHGLIHIFSFTEPENQVVTFFQTFCCHSGFVIQLCQFICPLFHIFCMFEFFERFNLLLQRSALRP